MNKKIKLYKVIFDFDWVVELFIGIKKIRDGFEIFLFFKNCLIVY